MKTQQEIQKYIAQIVEEISLDQRTATDVHPGQRIISDLGFDSLDYASILLRCEKWLGIKVKEDGVDWSKITTVGELAAFLESNQDANDFRP